MTGNLRLVGATGIQFTTGSLLQGNPSLTYGSQPVCVAGGPLCGDITTSTVTASTVTAAAYQYSTPVTRTYAVSPSAWSVNTPQMDHVHTGHWVYGSTPGQTVIFTAPVNLPDGAVVTSMRVYLKDADPVGDVEVDLLEHPFGSSNAFGAGAVVSSGALGDQALTDASIGQNPVDNDSQSHFLHARYVVPTPPSLVLIKDVLITYTVTVPLP